MESFLVIYRRVVRQLPARYPDISPTSKVTTTAIAAAQSQSVPCSGHFGTDSELLEDA
jgi:hypothetical protein